MTIEVPSYTVYIDEEAKNTERAGGLTKRLKERVIRSQIDNMNTTASMEPFERKPTKNEIDEMAKSLKVHYPSLINERHSLVSRICSLFQKKF